MVRAAKRGGDDDDSGDEPHRHRLGDPLQRDDQPVVAEGVDKAAQDPRRGQNMSHSPQADDPRGDVGEHVTHADMMHFGHRGTQGQKAHGSRCLAWSVGSHTDWLSVAESVCGNGE